MAALLFACMLDSQAAAPLAPGEIGSIIRVGTAQLPDGSSADDVGIAVDGASAQILHTGPNQLNAHPARPGSIIAACVTGQYP